MSVEANKRLSRSEAIALKAQLMSALRYVCMHTNECMLRSLQSGKQSNRIEFLMQRHANWYDSTCIKHIQTHTSTSSKTRGRSPQTKTNYYH
jgi:hypothetical protein